VLGEWLDAQSGIKRFFVMLMLIICGGCFCAFTVYLCHLLIFTHNDRFTLQEIEIEGTSGYWAGNTEQEKEDRARELASLLDIKCGRDNLFQLKLSALRRDAKNKIPEIDDITVRRVLPDQLVFNIVETQPRAFLRHDLVISSSGKLLNRNRCPNITNLPKLSYSVFPGVLREGIVFHDEQTALVLEFLKIATLESSYFDNIRVSKVFVKNKESRSPLDSNEIVVELIYKNDTLAPFLIHLDSNTKPDRLYTDVFGRLIPALDEGHSEPSISRDLDLRYENLVIVGTKQ